jgi:polyisoprenoid-binding protein YceI
MRLTSSILNLVFAITLVGGLPALAADTYTIDPAHSEVGFKVRHLGISKVSGRFTRFTGSVRLEDKDLSKSSVEVNIESASINTDSEARDKHLRTAEFFDTDKLPSITFKSVSVKEVAPGKLEVTGDFTLHGVTKRIVLPMTALGGAKSPFGDYRVGFEGALSINRGDYGIKTFPGVIGEEVSITLGVEAVKVEK